MMYLFDQCNECFLYNTGVALRIAVQLPCFFCFSGNLLGSFLARFPLKIRSKSILITHKMRIGVGRLR